jgi:hypothetical protein
LEQEAEKKRGRTELVESSKLEKEQKELETVSCVKKSSCGRSRSVRERRKFQHKT